MRVNMDKLMISFVMGLGVCLYAPTILEDCQHSNTEEKTGERYAQEVTEETTEVAVNAELPVEMPTEENTFAFSNANTMYAPKVSVTDIVANEEQLSKIETLVSETVDAEYAYSDFVAQMKELPTSAKPSLIPEVEKEKAQMVADGYNAFLDNVAAYYAEKEAARVAALASAKPATQNVQYQNITGDGVLTAEKGVNYGPSGKETYYNLDMSGVISIAKSQGIQGEYWVREDGVKMYGDYVMVAANLDTHPRGSIVESSLGQAIVVDTGGFAASDPNQLDIATAW